MDYQYTPEKIILKGKKITELDLFVDNFVRILEKYTNYVIVSGYAAIFFGRSRGTEDVDILIEPMNWGNFQTLYNKLSEKYDFLNSGDSKHLFNMLNEKLGIRIAEKGKIIPNIELKFIKYSFEDYAIKNSILIENESMVFKLSPIELQIAYKLYLGAEKDNLDAQFLYQIFEKDLNKKTLDQWLHHFKVKI